MTRAATVMAAMLIAATGLGEAGAAEEVEGVWLRPSTQSKIRIAPCGAELCGTLVFLQEPHLDVHNPDKAKRGRPLVGTTIVFGMTPTKTAGEWAGKVYNPEDGRTYAGVMRLDATDDLRLEGCVLGGLICKGETWKRSR
jgi:Uncharacterized protein conserved in bacteria